MAVPPESLSQFAVAARAYCEWAESNPGDGNEIFQARRLLLDLALSAIDLPYLVGDEVDGDRLTHDDWKKVYDRFTSLSVGNYSEMFDPFKLDDTPVIGDIADDLADIYRDVKEGLVLFDDGKLDEAAWEWRFNYIIHWGKHLTSALTVIHAYIAQHHPIEDGS